MDTRSDSGLEPNDVKAYAFPDVTTAPPEDPERYAVEPVAVWYRDFKTTAKGAYALSVGGTTSVADDAYGSSLTIGDAAAVIDTAAAPSGELTVLIKYRLQGRPTLTNEWENRPSFSEPGEANRFFRVKIIWGQEGIKP